MEKVATKQHNLTDFRNQLNIFQNCIIAGRLPAIDACGFPRIETTIEIRMSD